MEIHNNKLIAAFLFLLLFPVLSAAQEKRDIQNDPDYWCPKIKFVGRAAEIFELGKCEYISGITIRIIYNGKYSYPSRLEFTLLDVHGNVMPEDRNKNVFVPKDLKKGQYGIFTIQNYGNDNPSKIEIQGIWDQN